MLKPPVVSDMAPALLKLPPMTPGLERGHADRVAAVERQQLDVLRLDRLPDGDVGLQQRRFGGDGDFFGDGAGVEGEVERQRAAGVELHAGARRLLEALELGRNIVAPGCRFGNV